MTYDSTTIHNTIAMADTFRSIGYPASKVHYLVNRADSAGGIEADDELLRLRDDLDLEGRDPGHGASVEALTCDIRMTSSWCLL